MFNKFTNWISNKAQGISNKLGNAWETAKGTASKIWEKTKSAAKTTGKFLYDNSDIIASGLGAAAAGTAAYFGVDPGTILATREGIKNFADALPEGKVKDTLKSFVWSKKKSQVEPPTIDLTKEVPGGVHYKQALTDLYKVPINHIPGVSGGVISNNNISNRYVNDNIVHPASTVMYVDKKAGKRKKKML